MALPKAFETPNDYFEEALSFLNEHQNLFNFANTDILVKNVLENLSVNNLEEIDVFSKDFDLKTVDDEFLNNFFVKLESLKVCYDSFVEEKGLEALAVPVSLKKKHEIVYLAKEIQDMCETVVLDTIVDFGSGLGYLDQQLFARTEYNVMGLECNENHLLGAKKRQKKYHKNSMENVFYWKHTINEDSDYDILQFLYEEFPKYRGFCICGLHACGDLTVTALNIFLKMSEARALVIMPCCYHKMCKIEENGNKFNNFPLSNCLKNIFDRFQAAEYLNVPFLRLGAQPPNWQESLHDLVFNLLARAVLQVYAYKHNCKLKRNKQKAVRTKSMENNFETYIQDATTNGFTLCNIGSYNRGDRVEAASFDLDELRSIWRELSYLTMKKAGIFVLLQNYLQPVIENFILFDRLTYLKENGVHNCRFKKILDDQISPRCLAILASK